MSGEGLCRTSTLDADGTTSGPSSPVVETAIDASHPIVGYLPRSAETLWWNVPGGFTAHGHASFTAQEGNGGFDLDASDATGQHVLISNVTPSNILPSALLHFTSLSLSWLVTSSTTPAATIGIRVRISPFQDGGGNRCLIYSCDPETGPQVCSPAAAGTLCSDGNACNGTETCDGEGACVAGTNLANGTSCSDGNACNGNETCQAGACAPGTPLSASDVDDHNACTADSCDPSRGGIVNELLPACQANANAPPLDQTTPTSFDKSTDFLYTGASPVQTGVAPGTIDTSRVAVIRGRVFTSPSMASATKTAAPGAIVTIVNHPEYGSTLTRNDGYFDLAVNGGAPFAVNIAKAGMLTMQRTVATEPHGYAIVEDVVLTAPYTSPDTFTPGVASTTIIHGELTPAGEDADDPRQAVIMLPPGTYIKNYAGAGPLAVQLTEYTRGPNGQARMPGELPPTTGYTYAFEASIPGAGQDVAFVNSTGEETKNVVVYIDNFTKANAGEDVPLGYYDRTKAAWLTQKSGKTIKIVSKSSGTVTLDVTGDGIADSGTALTELGITDDELQAIASQPQWGIGKTLWRITMNHFSPWDCNWGFGPPANAVYPVDPNPNEEVTDCNSKKNGSIIGCESRTLGESIPIVGTPFSLHYESDRVLAGKAVRIWLSGADPIPPSLNAILVQIHVAGRSYYYVFDPPARPNVSISWTWDGLDAYGRFTQGTTPVRINVGYEYDGVTTSGSGGFGAGGGASSTISGIRIARKIILWRSALYKIYNFDAHQQGFGGWTINAHHVLDPESGSLYRGDSEREPNVRTFANPVVDTFVAGGTYTSSNFTGPANGMYLDNVNDMEIAADGSLILADMIGVGGIRRVANGTATLVAGGGTGPKADGQPALGAAIHPSEVAVAPDGSIVFSEVDAHRVWRVDAGPNPLLHLVAGNGIYENSGDCPALPGCGDGGLAVKAYVRSPRDIEVASDGAIYFADSGHGRIRRIDPGGVITTYAANLPGVTRIRLLPSGAIYATDSNFAVRRIGPQGPIDTMPVTSDWWKLWCGDATNGYSTQSEVVPFPDESMVMSCRNRILGRTTSGEIIRLAGDGIPGFAGDGGPALSAKFENLQQVTLGKNGDIYVLDQVKWNTGRRIRRIRSASAIASVAGALYRVADKDGSKIFEFDASARHTKTYSALQGTALLSFGHDPVTHQLSSITDDAGNTTTITRSAGQVTITAPHNQVTVLGLDSNGWLQSVMSPKIDEITHVTHAANGLLTQFVDPKGNAHQFMYSGGGLLMLDRNAHPGSKGARLSSTPTGRGWFVDYLSPEDRRTRYEVMEQGPFGDDAVVERRTKTEGLNLVTQTDRYRDGSTSRTYPDGSTVKVLSTSADPRWGASVLRPSATRVTTGSHSMTRSESWSGATLANAADPFSMTQQTVTTTLSGAGLPNAVTTSVFAAGSPSTWTTTFPTTSAGKNRQVRVALDTHERITEVANTKTDPVVLYPVSFHYDAFGRVDLVTHGSRTYTRSYDSAGWLQATTDPAGLGVTYAARDTNGRPKLVNLAGSRTLAFDYDLGGNLSSVTPPSKPAHTFAWGPTNALATYSAPSPPVAQSAYTYDADGLLTLKSQPGTTTSLAYDDIGRLSQVGDNFDSTLFTYDAAGRLAIAANSAVTIANTSYNGALVEAQMVTGPFTYVSNITYDNFFRVSGWNGVSFAYDVDGSLTTAGAMSLVRGDTGLLKSTTLGTVTDGFTYNGYGEVIGHTSTGYSSTYDRDVAGRIHVLTETIGTTTTTTRYEYDSAGRLWQVYVNGALTPTREYTYDSNGNRTDGANYDGQDRQGTLGGMTLQYTANGDLWKKTNFLGSVTKFTYDGHGSLRTVDRPAPAAGIEYVIDGYGRRVGKKVGGALVQGFVYNGSRIVAELDGSGAEVARLVYATGHSPDFMMKGGTTYRFIKDHVGSPRLVIEASTGTIAQRIDYDEWGNVTADTAPGFQPLGFAGGLRDRDTGLVRFGARDYDPTTGRWTTKDRIRFAGGLNLYGYAHNDPVNRIDPSGFDPFGGGDAVVWSQWDVSLAEQQSWDMARGQGASAGLTTLAGLGLVDGAAGGMLGTWNSLRAWLFGAPAAAAVASQNLQGQLTGQASRAGQCVDYTKRSVEGMGGTPINASGILTNHWANKLGNGLIDDDTLRDNLAAYGKYVGDIPVGKSLFTEAEWFSLVSRFD